MEELLSKLFSEFGIVATLFIVIVLGIIHMIFKAARYLPVAVQEHFTVIREQAQQHNEVIQKQSERYIEENKEARKDFKESLEKITKENKEVTTGLLNQFRKQAEDHERIIKVMNNMISTLNKIDRTQDEINGKIK